MMRHALGPALGKSIAIRNLRILRGCPSPAGLVSGRVKQQNARRRLSTTPKCLDQSGNNESEQRDGAKTSKDNKILVSGSYDYRAEAIREAFRNAPLFSSAARDFVESVVDNPATEKHNTEKLVSQYGLVGTLQRFDANKHTEQEEVDIQQRLVIANLDFPWSAFICGSKGSGKSHTLACLVVNALSLKADPDAKQAVMLNRQPGNLEVPRPPSCSTTTPTQKGEQRNLARQLTCAIMARYLSKYWSQPQT